MYSESNNTNENENEEHKVHSKLECYIIPYNESFEYVFITEIINTLKLKTKLQNIRKCCINKKWFQSQQLDSFKYAIHFYCDIETMTLIKHELVIRHLWIRKLKEEHLNQLTNNLFFNE